MSNPNYNLKAEVSQSVYDNITQFKGAISNNIMQELDVHAICTDLIIKSRWASWLPFGWMHSLAASYYARKARRVYKNQKRPA